MTHIEQPEFASVEEMFAHHRGLIDLQAIEVAARAVAELEAEGVAVSAAMKEQLAERIRTMLHDKLDEAEMSINHPKGN